MLSWLGFGGERESFDKLLAFVRNPFRFFEKNRDDEESLLRVVTFIVRLGVVVDVIVMLFQGRSLGTVLGSLIMVGILLARILAVVGLAIGAWVTNIFLGMFYDKPDILVTKRVVAYSFVTTLLPNLLITQVLDVVLGHLLVVVGLVKQYRMSWWRALLVVIVPAAILLMTTYWLFTLPPAF